MKFDNRHLPDPRPPLPSNFNVRREAWLTAYAETSCQVVEALSALLAKGTIPEGSPEYFATVNTIYVVYGRPFHRCAGVGRLEKTDIPGDRLDVHDHLMLFRDKVYAHKDTPGIQIEDDYTANEVRAIVGGDSAVQIFCTEFHTRPPKMPDIQSHARVLQSNFGARMKDLMEQLLPGGRMPGGQHLHDGEFILTVDWQEDQPFKRVPNADTYVYGQS